MANFIIKKGMNINLAGAPDSMMAQALDAAQVAVIPTEYIGMKTRLKVKEGDTVKRGTPVLFDKKNPAFNICAPAGGRVSQIVYGKRRVLERIVIDVDAADPSEKFDKFKSDELLKADRTKIITHLQQTGLLALLIARPFSRMAKADTLPKSIFVNGMNTAPYQPDINFVILGQEQNFQAGLNVLTRLTDGKVHLCLDGSKQNVSTLKDAQHVDVHYFSGPHPSGNASVHIHHIDAISPGDTVWTIKAQDVILIGQLFLNGEYPTHRVITLAGPAINKGSARHYKIRLGGSLAKLFSDHVEKSEVRIVSGDFLSGAAVPADSFLRLHDRGFTVLPEDRERHFLGWLAPGHNRLSSSRTFVSKWLGQGRSWALGTNQRGESRPLVLTGLYDKYMPMNIMVDFLVRAVLARDADEAMALGLLETDPEDFSICAFVCPSKMDLCGIIRKGLDQVEKEGI